MKHSGVRPPAQPRTLRTIAEDKGSAANGFEGIGETDQYDKDEGVPTAHPGTGGSYNDVAQAAKPGKAMARRGLTPSDPKPFSNLRGRNR